MARPPFGGMQISFRGCHETMEDVFGLGNLTPSEMTALLWRFIKREQLVVDRERRSGLTGRVESEAP